MKKTTAIRLTFIFSMTLILSLVGIIFYISSNPASAETYFTRLNHNTTVTHVTNGFGWLDFIPFIDDDVKEYVNGEINDAIREGLTEAKEATEGAIESSKKSWNNNWNVNWNNGNVNVSWSNNRFKKYKTINNSIVDNFSTATIKDIDIQTDISNLIFVEEDRQDVQVDYAYSKPDTSDYTVIYDAELKGNTLVIQQELKIKNYPSSIDAYDNDITIRIPKGLQVDQLSYHNNLGAIKDSFFYSRVKELELNASLGKIDIKLDNDLDKVKLVASMGDLKLVSDADITTLDMKADNGKLNLTSRGDIKNLIMNASMGSITTNNKGTIHNCTMNADMGSIRGTFYKQLKSLKVKCDMGSVDLTLYENDYTVFNTDVSMGKLTTDFQKGSNKDFEIECDMGSITLRKK